MENSAYVQSFVKEYKELLAKYSGTLDPKLFELLIGRYEYAMFIQDEIRNGCVEIAKMCEEGKPYEDIKNKAHNYAFLGHE